MRHIPSHFTPLSIQFHLPLFVVRILLLSFVHRFVIPSDVRGRENEYLHQCLDRVYCATRERSLLSFEHATECDVTRDCRASAFG